MIRAYLVVFEKGNECWGAFAPDVSGTSGMGNTLEEARTSLIEGIGYMLDYQLENDLPMPEAKSTSVDFSEFDPDPASNHYVIEWLSIQLPDHAPQRIEQQAA